MTVARSTIGVKEGDKVEPAAVDVRVLPPRADRRAAGRQGLHDGHPLHRTRSASADQSYEMIKARNLDEMKQALSASS